MTPIKRVYRIVTNLDQPKPDYIDLGAGVEAEEKDANVVSSVICPGIHAPVLDIDFEARLIPSSTPGHYHLYLDKAMSWKKYRKLLKALARAGVIEEGYAFSSIRRGFSAVRKPDIKKPEVLL